MTTRKNTYYQHPRYKVNAVSATLDDITTTTEKTTEQSTNNTVNPPPPPTSSSKPKISLWPTILWIGLAILLSITLVLLVIIPIAVLANKGDSTNSSTICPTTAITTTVTSSPLPAQCSSYTTVEDDTRSPYYTGATTCDDPFFSTTPTWVRFVGSGGTILASCPIDGTICAADAPGWYSGVYPALAGYTTSGYVCFSFNSDYCYWSYLILVTNCNGFYVYYLKAPPACDLRHCTI